MKNKTGIIIGIVLGLFFLGTRKGKAGGFGSSGTSGTANFNDWIKPGTRRYRRIKAGYTLEPSWDRGHWTSGIVNVGTKAGTNMSIAAFTYLDWMKQSNPSYVLTEQKMRDMPEAVARQIYKVKYWDKVRGSEIKSQLIANFVADMKSSGGGVKNFQKALNVLGATLIEDGSFGDLTLAATNSILMQGKECLLNNEFRRQQILYYQSLTNQHQNWYDSLDLDYPQLIC